MLQLQPIHIIWHSLCICVYLLCLGLSSICRGEGKAGAEEAFKRTQFGFVDMANTSVSGKTWFQWSIRLVRKELNGPSVVLKHKDVSTSVFSSWTAWHVAKKGTSEQHFYNNISWTPTLCHIQLALVSNLTQTKSIFFHPCGVLMLTPSDSQGGQIINFCHLIIAKFPHPGLLPCYLRTLQLTLRAKHSIRIHSQVYSQLQRFCQ